MSRARKLWIGMVLMAFGCAPAPPNAVAEKNPPSESTTAPAASSNAASNADSRAQPSLTNPNPVEAHIVPDPYVLGQPLTGRVLGAPEGQPNGTLTIAMCSAEEWRRAQREKRPPIPAETVTVDLDRPGGERFSFSMSPEIVGAMMLYPLDRESRVRVRPVEVRPREGGPPGSAGPVDGVGTSGSGAPVDAHDPALQAPNR